MVLLPAGLLVGKALIEKMTRNATPVRVARTSAMASIHNYSQPRKRLVRRTNGTLNPFARDEVLNRCGGTSVRRSHTQVEREQQRLREALEDEKWVPVYRYPGIRLGVILARAKLIQTIASVLYLPYSSWQFAMGHAEPHWFYSTAAMAVLAPILLAAFSRYLNRLVGVIAMNESNDHVRVGYLTFWGSRKNRIIELSDVLPLSEMGGNKADSLVRFSWFGGNDFLYLPIEHAELVDEERAELLFGDLSIFHKVKKNN